MGFKRTLADLRPGQSAYIRMVGGEPAFRLRLAELGMTPGIRISLLRRAPLGDPVVLSLRGYELSMRLSDARQIEVERGKGG